MPNVPENNRLDNSPFLTKDENSVFRESGNIQSSIVFGLILLDPQKICIHYRPYSQFVIVLSGSKAIQYSINFLFLKCEIDFDDTETS